MSASVRRRLVGRPRGRRFIVGRRRTLVYSLSLAVYCTSWTYYGSVGIASAQGFDFLPIYIGPILVVGFGHRLVARIAALARAQNLTTVADFVSARYGKSQAAAALAALIALIAAAPYIALQLKAITADDADGGRLVRARPADAGRAVVAVLSRRRRCCSPPSPWRSARGGSIRPSIRTG